jgi:hypothetical protein
VKKNGNENNKLGNGVIGRGRPKTPIGARRKSSFIHVVAPATASQIERALGITKTQKTKMLRAFAAAGVKL